MKKLLLVILLASQTSVSGQTSLPYPVIFIHGLNSQSSTWDILTDNTAAFTNLNFGGRMDFCLNNDGNDNTSNFTDDYLDFTATVGNTLRNGDYYYVNFDVDRFGNTNPGAMTDVRSNQSAIFKQGRAIRDAIKHVLAATGKNKVILVGHSMGGLASREYLSNSTIWQSDGKHHVAKFFSNATPHGGSNSALGSLSLVKSVDERYEAVRDLRSYFAFTNLFLFEIRRGNGTYLFGGNENFTDIKYSLALNYKNIDVNCNGWIGNNVVGLNQKSSPSDVQYSCAIGVGKNLTSGGTDVYSLADGRGDGIVGSNRANMNNYIPANPPLQTIGADTFQFKKNAFFEFHTDMTKEYELNMRGLDEPSTIELAYEIDTSKLYKGWSTAQSDQGLGNHYDIDTYKFDMKPDNLLKVLIEHDGLDAGFVFGMKSTTAYEHIVALNQNVIDTVIIVENTGTNYFVLALPARRGNVLPYAFKLSLLPKLKILMEPVSQTICGNDLANFSVSVSGTGPFGYVWNNGSTQRSISTNIAGEYSVTVTGPYDFKVSQKATLTLTITDCKPIITNQLVSKSVCGSSFTDFTIAATGFGSQNYTYLWNSGETTNSIVTSTPGMYVVTINGNKNYTTVSATATLTSINCDGLTNVLAKSADNGIFVEINPNPVEKNLKVKTNLDWTNFNVEIINEQGMKIKSFISNSNEFEIETDGLIKGIYLLKISSSRGLKTVKFCKL